MMIVETRNIVLISKKCFLSCKYFLPYVYIVDIAYSIINLCNIPWNLFFGCTLSTLEKISISRLFSYK